MRFTYTDDGVATCDEVMQVRSYASGGPAGVGVAVGRAIRTSLVVVVLLNLLMSIIFYGGGNTVKIAG